MSIPSPSTAEWAIGPFPLRAYALCIIAGAIVAIVIGEKRYTNRGGRSGLVMDIAIWAIPFGIVGARLYHVLTDINLYFGDGPNWRPVEALYIWQGGLGIWGGIAAGALGAWIACRRYGVAFKPVADALAPGLLIGQAIGRFGNWFNQELYGAPTELPWGLEIDQAHRVAGYMDPDLLFHPTFLYEALWNVAGAAALIWLIAPRVAFGHGRQLAVYVMIYTAGRWWIEMLRIDPVNDFGGIRLNVYTSFIVFGLALTYFILTRDKREPVELASSEAVDDS